MFDILFCAEVFCGSRSKFMQMSGLDACRFFLVLRVGTLVVRGRVQIQKLAAQDLQYLNLKSDGSEGHRSICTHQAHQSTEVEEVHFFSSMWSNKSRFTSE